MTSLDVCADLLRTSDRAITALLKKNHQETHLRFAKMEQLDRMNAEELVNYLKTQKDVLEDSVDAIKGMMKSITLK